MQQSMKNLISLIKSVDHWSKIINFACDAEAGKSSWWSIYYQNFVKSFYWHENENIWKF